AGPSVPLVDPQGRSLPRSALEPGRPIEFITSDGTRPDRLTVYPVTAEIDTPRPGAAVRSGFTASGRAQLFEAAGTWVLYRYPAQVRAQHLRDHHAPVRPLVILQDGGEGATDGDAATVKRVDELGARGRRRSVADVGAAGLEVPAVRAGRDLDEPVLAGKPHFEIHLLGAGEAEVAGADQDHSVGQAKPLEHRLGVGNQGLVLGGARLRRRELHHLDLVE